MIYYIINVFLCSDGLTETEILDRFPLLMEVSDGSFDTRKKSSTH